MARYDGKNLIGSIGNLSYSVQDGRNIVRAKPGWRKMKQTKLTKQRASVFGTYISPFAKFVRLILSELTGNFHDRTMVNRMNAEIATIFYQHEQDDQLFSFQQDSFNRLMGFEFNLKSPLSKSLLMRPRIAVSDNLITVNLPEFLIAKNVRFPAQSDAFNLYLQIAQLRLGDGLCSVSPMETFEFKRDDQLSEAKTFNFPNIPGNLFLVAMRVEYFNEKIARMSMNMKTFNPAAICGVVYTPGVTPSNIPGKWFGRPPAIPIKI